uniref:Uncharacterized protein n=1 Tax=Salix viminalis TaxID=40686 RepID=A0A6N2LWZ7_SALVM
MQKQWHMASDMTLRASFILFPPQVETTALMAGQHSVEARDDCGQKKLESRARSCSARRSLHEPAYFCETSAYIKQDKIGFLETYAPSDPVNSTYLPERGELISVLMMEKKYILLFSKKTLEGSCSNHGFTTPSNYGFLTSLIII